RDKTMSDRVAQVVERVEEARDQVEEKVAAARQRFEEARAQRSGDDVVRGLEDVFGSVERGLSRVFSELPAAIGRSFDTLRFWPEQVVDQEYEGEFPAGLAEAEVALVTRDGAITVEAGDGPGYKVVVTNHVRTDDT